MTMLMGTLSVALFAVMIAYAGDKTVIVEGGNPDEIVETVKEPVLSRWKLQYDDSDDNPNEEMHFSFLIPGQVDGSKISYYTRYDEPSIVIICTGENATNLSKGSVSGNLFYIKEAGGIYDGEKATLTFSLECACFTSIRISGHLIEVDFTPCADYEGCVVAIDPSFGGSQNGAIAGDIYEKNVTGRIASFVAGSNFTTDVKAVSIREGDFSMNTENRLAAIKNIGASAYVGIRLSTNTDDLHAFGMKASYNGEFYSNEFSSIEFANDILRNVASKAKDKALGLFEANETEAILQVIDIPSVYLYAGFLSNEQEAALLANDTYLKNISEGIVGGLDEYYIRNGK